MTLDRSFASACIYLKALRNAEGYWSGRLSSSALSTATAVVALKAVDGSGRSVQIEQGVGWLVRNQNEDGGWGDTTDSQSNFSTTLLVVGALTLCGKNQFLTAVNRGWEWIELRAGGRSVDMLVKETVARYGKDKTFSVPILMHSAICGLFGDNQSAWKQVLALPFEMAALPRSWFGAIGLPVVSYALPALIAIGHARFRLAPPAWWNPLRWLRKICWSWRVRPMLAELQPSTGGYLEATPLTSFVTMALASSGEAAHPCVSQAIQFLCRSMREDGSWPIDTNLATWGTTLAVKSGIDLVEEDKLVVRDWILSQQYHEVHPFTNAAPGGWAWTDLAGGVPDADDTPGAMMALRRLGSIDDSLVLAAAKGAKWLLDLQNRDGGIPTFCRGWGTLPFDRSTPELTAHTLAGLWLWHDDFVEVLQVRIGEATHRCFDYLNRVQRSDGSWIPLWFGNEWAPDHENPVYGTSQVVGYLCADPRLRKRAGAIIDRAVQYLLSCQLSDGSWGGAANTPPSIEETAVAVIALLKARAPDDEVLLSAAMDGVNWLMEETQSGSAFQASPIGLYFAKLWYSEQLYPVVWTVEAFRLARESLR